MNQRPQQHSLAEDPAFLDRVQRWVDEVSKKTLYHTLELPGGHVAPGLIPVEALRNRLDAIGVPQDLTGKRVLDVGAASGWNSFELERRGAAVTAVDCVEYPELITARELLRSRVDYRILDVEEILPETCGMFDTVLFLGVLYHLRHPLLGLERICAVTREAAFVESYVTDSDAAPDARTAIEFYEIDELGGQIDNWCGPTTKALAALCRAAGFARVEPRYSANNRAAVVCWRTWEPAREASADPPRLIHAVNNRTHGNVFHPGRDEYICVYFRGHPGLTKEALRPEIDGLGVPVLTAAQIAPGEWQANLRLPPGLGFGRHTLRMRTTDSGFSNELTLEAEPPGSTRQAVFVTREAGSEPAPVILRCYNSADRGTVFHGYRSEYLSCFIRTPVAGLGRENVLVSLDDVGLEAVSVIDLGEGEWQINARLPQGLAVGLHAVRVRTSGSDFSSTVEIQVSE